MASWGSFVANPGYNPQCDPSVNYPVYDQYADMAALTMIAGFEALPFHKGKPIEMTEISAEDLRDRLDNLPCELYDMVYDLVFSVEPNQQPINKFYKPPVQIQVDRATRTKLLPIYYGTGSTWVFDNQQASEQLLPQWYGSMPGHFMRRFARACEDNRPCWHFQCVCGKGVHIYQAKRSGRTKPYPVVGIFVDGTEHLL